MLYISVTQKRIVLMSVCLFVVVVVVVVFSFLHWSDSAVPAERIIELRSYQVSSLVSNLVVGAKG